MRATDTIRYDEAQWDVAARDVLHPSGRPKTERGLLLCNRNTGLFVWLGLGGAMRSVDPAAAMATALRAFRAERGWSQAQLAAALPLPSPDKGGQVTVARWESGSLPQNPQILLRALRDIETHG